MKRRDIIESLLNTAAVKRYVNLVVPEIAADEQSFVKQIISVIQEMEGPERCLEVDIGAFRQCKNEREEAEVLVKIIHETLSGVHHSPSIKEGISITHIMDQVNETLDRPALIIFHFFQDYFSEREKEILRSIRKYIALTKLQAEYPRLLGILIVSLDRVDKWTLFPESQLDSRYVTFFEYS
jgi:hypothetical protein